MAYYVLEEEESEQFRFGLSYFIIMTTILSLYLSAIYLIGPRYMKNRKPYELKRFMVFYNISQIIACVYVLERCLTATGVEIFLFWKCRHPGDLKIYDHIVYFTYWLKTVELVETIVFVLRKKQNQISYLHVFHHCSTITLVFIAGNFYRGLGALFPLILNSIVHIFMYSYYLTAAVCSKRVLQALVPVKKSITTVQMIQFSFILAQATSHYIGCTISKVVIIYYSVVIAIMFYGFYDFYKKAYNTKNSTKIPKTASVHQS